MLKLRKGVKSKGFGLEMTTFLAPMSDCSPRYRGADTSAFSSWKLLPFLPLLKPFPLPWLAVFGRDSSCCEKGIYEF